MTELLQLEKIKKAMQNMIFRTALLKKEDTLSSNSNSGLHVFDI